MLKNKLQSKKIIVTGASSGIGKHLCWHIAKNGGIPIMLARSLDKLTELEAQLKKELQAASFIYQVDLSISTDINKTIAQILHDHPRIDGLINNAGIGVFDFVQDMKHEDVQQMFQLNVFACMQLTQKILPHFQANGSGHIINIASQAAKISTPKSAAYGASKQALLAFTNTLRQEVSKINVFVTAVNLGPVRTNFFKLADPEGTYSQSVASYMLDPDRVANKIIANIFTTKREINMPFWMEIGSFIYKLFPGTMERLFRSQFNKK